MSLLEVQDLKKYYPAASGLFAPKRFVKALDGVSFNIEKGETVGLVGESGCGKSTLARSLMRLEEPTSGKFFLNGVDMCALHGEKLRKMRNNFQMIFQDPFASLNPRMTIFEVLDEVLRLHTDLDGKDRRAEMWKLMEMVGLNPNHIRRYPHQFSGGQRQRIGIARALAVNPKFIVADEPVSALDVSVQAQIVNLLQEIQAKTQVSYLFIAHDLAVVEHISHRIMVMYLGKIVEIGPAHELCTAPLHPYTKALLSAAPSMRPENKKERIILAGDVPSPLNPPAGCRFHTRCPFATPACSQCEPELHEISPGHFSSCILNRKHEKFLYKF